LRKEAMTIGRIIKIII